MCNCLRLFLTIEVDWNNYVTMGDKSIRQERNKLEQSL